MCVDGYNRIIWEICGLVCLCFHCTHTHTQTRTCTHIAQQAVVLITVNIKCGLVADGISHNHTQTNAPAHRHLKAARFRSSRRCRSPVSVSKYNSVKFFERPDSVTLNRTFLPSDFSKRVSITEHQHFICPQSHCVVYDDKYSRFLDFAIQAVFDHYRDGAQLFLVYFWQMESVTVYVCGLPSVDHRVF